MLESTETERKVVTTVENKALLVHFDRTKNGYLVRRRHPGLTMGQRLPTVAGWHLTSPQYRGGATDDSRTTPGRLNSHQSSGTTMGWGRLGGLYSRG